MKKEIYLNKLNTYLRLKSQSLNTIKMYKFYTEKFLDYMIIHNNIVEEANEEALLGYFIDLQDNGKSIRTQALNKVIVSFFYKKVIKKDIKEILESIKIKIPIRTPKTLSHQEAIKFIKGIEREDYKLIFELMYFCGLRIDEAINITGEQVVQKYVIGKGNKQRTIYMNDKFRERLIRYGIKVKAKNKFFHNCGSSALQKYFKRRVISLGLSEDISPHILRKSFATNMLNLGYNLISVQRWLGHSSLETTKRYVGQIEEDYKGDLYF